MVRGDIEAAGLEEVYGRLSVGLRLLFGLPEGSFISWRAHEQFYPASDKIAGQNIIGGGEGRDISPDDALRDLALDIFRFSQFSNGDVYNLVGYQVWNKFGRVNKFDNSLLGISLQYGTVLSPILMR